MSARRVVAFVVDPKDCARWRDIATLDDAAVDAQQQRFRSGIDVWIVQSYLLLRAPLMARGYDVRFGARYPRDAVCIAHWDDLNAYFNGAHRGHVIGVRADRSPLSSCERVVVQNDLAPLGCSERYVPHWPQPGLVMRDPARPPGVRTLAYFGRLARLPQWLRSAALRDRLAAAGVALQLSAECWNDYGAVDAAVSVRTESPSILRHKPATKLTNAWLAGVPALLNDEPAFVRLRASPLDYLAVDSPDAVVAAVARLNAEPALYQAMVDHGHARAREFTRAAITARWLDVIDEVAAARAPLPSLVGFVRSVSAQRREARRFRAQHIVEQARAAL